MSKRSLTIQEVRERSALILSAMEFAWPDGSNGSDRDIFVDAWKHLGVPDDKAISLAREPLTVHLALLLDGIGLEAILADRHATDGLKKCLIENHPPVRRALARYAKNATPKGKPGPRPRKGGYLTTQVLRLREDGKTFGQIATELWKDPHKRNHASALIAQANKRASAKKLPPKPTA